MGLGASPEDLKLFRSAGWRRKQTCFVRFWGQTEEATGKRVAVQHREIFREAGAKSRVVSFLFPKKDRMGFMQGHSEAMSGLDVS